MPNATCFLIAYGLVLVSELARFASKSASGSRWNARATTALFAVAFLTHTLYLVDRVWNAWSGDRFKPFSSWQDWGMVAAWTLAIAFAWMTWRRSDKQIGVFILPLILAIVGLAIAIPSSEPIVRAESSQSFWRLVHSAAMLLGTMFVTLGFAVACMYFVQAWRLKHLGASGSRIRLPSLEYLQSMGRKCMVGSAAAIGFGVVSGVIMNLTRDGQVAWTDRGILLTGALFLWLCIAALAQWASSQRGLGEWTAIMSILSFVIVVVALAVIVSRPHSSEPVGGGSRAMRAVVGASPSCPSFASGERRGIA
jgi:hypothetical protein